DESKVFVNKFRNTESLLFLYSDEDVEELKGRLRAGDDDQAFLLHIGPFEKMPEAVELFSSKQAGIDLLEEVNDQMEQVLRDKMLTEAGIDTSVLNSLKVDVPMHTVRLTET